MYLPEQPQEVPSFELPREINLRVENFGVHELQDP
jgi:hypothetical protein